MPVNSSSVGHEVVRNGNLDFVSPVCFQSLSIVRPILQEFCIICLLGPDIARLQLTYASNIHLEPGTCY